MGRTNSPREEPAHDVLAAEAFAMPGPDPVLHHEPLRVPDDPTGIAEPHDILAAEEFAMPAAEHAGVAGALARHTASPWRRAAIAVVVAAVALMLLIRNAR